MRISNKDKEFLKECGIAKTVSQWVDFFNEKQTYYQLKYFFEENGIETASYTTKTIPQEELVLRRRQEEFNITIFEEWNADSAYLIGYFFDHCHIYKNGIFDLMIRASVGNREMFRKIATCFNQNHAIWERSNKEILRITFFCPKICADLMDKTDFVNFPSVPQDQIADFIRGWSDSHMKVAKKLRKVKSMTLTYELDNERFFTFLNAVLKKFAGVEGQRRQSEKRGHFYFYVNEHEVYKFGAFLYSNATGLKVTKIWKKFLTQVDPRFEEPLDAFQTLI